MLSIYKKDFKCNCCGQTNILKIHLAKEKMYGTNDTFDYIECAECGSLQIAKVPDNLGKYYPKNYYSLVNNNDSVNNSSFIRSFLLAQRTNYLLQNKGLLGKAINHLYPDYFDYPWSWFSKTNCSSSSNILDIGCGRGDLLYALRDQGFKQLKGIDPFISAPVKLPSLNIQKSTIFDTEGTFDLIMAHHSLEHVATPLLYLQKMKSLCKIQGSILIRLPIASYLWKHYCTNWFELDAPRHLWLPTIEGFQSLINRVPGLKLINTTFDSTPYEYCCSELYKKGIPQYDSQNNLLHKPNNFFSKEEIELFKDKSSEHNKTGQASRATFILIREH